MKIISTKRRFIHCAFLGIGVLLLAGQVLHGYRWREDEDYQDAQTAARLEAEKAAREVHRNRWRGTYARPAGYALYKYGGYTYYRAGSTYYTPYFYGGRTVYLQVRTVDGKPLPPPPPDSIVIDFD